MVGHGAKLSMQLGQNVLRHLRIAFLLFIKLSESSVFLLNLPELDKLNLLPISTYLFLCLFLLILELFRLFLFLFFVVIRAIIVGIVLR